MSTVNFYVRSKQTKEKQVSIWIRIRVGKRIDIRQSIGISITSSLWNNKKNCIKDIFIDSEKLIHRLQIINSYLAEIREIVYLELLKNNDINSIQLRKIIKNHLDEKISCNPEKVISLSSYLVKKIEQMENKTFLNKGLPYSRNSLLNWKKFLNLWNSYTEQALLKDISPDDVSMDTYYSFVNHCNSKDYTKNTKHLYVTLLKAALNYAFDDGFSKNTIQKNRNFTASAEENHENIYLSTPEIKILSNLNLNDNLLLSKVKDIFLIGCYTGLRVSDYSSLSIDDLTTISIGKEKYPVFRKKQKKTGNDVIIPIMHKEVFEILNKWGGKLPKVSVSTINSQIKNICKIAMFMEKIKRRKYIKGSEVEYLTEKYRVVSSHTARRSFITNLYLEGNLDIVQIKSLSGHKSEQAFHKYLCQSKEDNIRRILEQTNMTNINGLKSGHTII